LASNLSSHCTASCTTSVNVQAGPAIACSEALALNCASSTGALGTVFANVSDTATGQLAVVWSVNGVSIQTNVVASPVTTQIHFTNFFALGTNLVSASVSDSNGCTAACSTVVLVKAAGLTITCSAPSTIDCA